MVRLYIIVTALLLCGCGSRRKTVESVKVRSSYELAADSVFSYLAQLRAESNRLYNASVDEKNRVIEYDGQSGDSLQMEEYGPDGKLKSRTIVKGKGKAVISEGTKLETVSESATTKQDEQKSGSGSGSVKIKAEAAQEDLKKQVDSPGVLKYWWLLLILGGLWYLNKRYGWWSKIKSHVTTSKTQ